MIPKEQLADFAKQATELVVAYKEAGRRDRKENPRPSFTSPATMKDIPEAPDYVEVARLRIRELGWLIYAEHGLNGMQQVTYECDDRTLSALDARWDGVGIHPNDWRH